MLMSCNNKCQNIICRVKKYLNEKDMEGLKRYIEKEEISINQCRIMSKNESADYIDTLIKELN